jgi:hypothetical protein
LDGREKHVVQSVNGVKQAGVKDRPKFRLRQLAPLLGLALELLGHVLMLLEQGLDYLKLRS